MKHNTIYVILTGMVLVSLTGCLDVVNSDRLNSTNMWVEESDITGATNGIYYDLRTAFTQDYTNQFYWGELRVGPALWDRGTHRSLLNATQVEVLHSNISSSTSSADWTYLYTCINQCNSVLKYAPRVSMSDSNYNYCMGNAYFVRALCYYWIARIWGDAPIILNPTEGTGSEIFPSRSDKSEVYALVESDIDEALTYITDNSSGCYYATKDNLNMLKTDYALWMYSTQGGGNSYLTMAEAALGEISNATLLDNFADVFDVKNKENKEIMFALHIDAISEIDSIAFIQHFVWGSAQILTEYQNVEGGVPVYFNQFLCFSDEFISELKENKENGDQRTDVTYQEKSGVSEMYDIVEWPNKFTGDTSTGDLLFDDDLIIYRGAQYYMFLAELNYYKGNYSEALNNLNVVAERAYGKSNFYTSAAKDDVWEALAKENRWEFAEEGNIWFTYIRLGYIDSYCPIQYWENTGVQGGVGGSTNPNIYLFPISKSSMNKNANLKQTEGWS